MYKRSERQIEKERRDEKLNREVRLELRVLI